jgi:hypothetical protein
MKTYIETIEDSDIPDEEKAFWAFVEDLALIFDIPPEEVSFDVLQPRFYEGSNSLNGGQDDLHSKRH